MAQPPGYPYPPRSFPGPVPAPQPGPGAPVHVEPIPGTEFGLAYAALPPVTSGQAVGALVAGIASILVSLVTICFGLAGAAGGWGALVAGAFAILATLLGAAAISVGVFARRVIRGSYGAISGAGMATAGLVCGIVGTSLAVLGFTGALIATLSA